MSRVELHCNRLQVHMNIPPRSRAWRLAAAHRSPMPENPACPPPPPRTAGTFAGRSLHHRPPWRCAQTIPWRSGSLKLMSAARPSQLISPRPLCVPAVAAGAACATGCESSSECRACSPASGKVTRFRRGDTAVHCGQPPCQSAWHDTCCCWCTLRQEQVAMRPRAVNSALQCISSARPVDKGSIRN
jgi:hypothetical protein